MKKIRRKSLKYLRNIGFCNIDFIFCYNPDENNGRDQLTYSRSNAILKIFCRFLELLFDIFKFLFFILCELIVDIRS